VKKDIRRELDKIGKVISLLVPRKKDNHPEEAVGRVYVEFENENYSIVAYLLLQGKQYD
jgi:splicing factor U2AF subunit